METSQELDKIMKFLAACQQQQRELEFIFVLPSTNPISQDCTLNKHKHNPTNIQA